MRKVISTILVLAVSVVGIFAATLKNQDSKTYEIQIIESSTTNNTSIEGGTTMANVCSECEIKIVGDDSETGRIKVGKDDVIIIKDGKLSKEQTESYGIFGNLVCDLIVP